MLVDRRHRAVIVRLSLLSGATAALASGVSLANADIYAGVVAPDLMAGSVGFDVMSLIIAVGLLVCTAAIGRGHERSWLVWTGMQGYLLYAYAIYAFGLVFTPLYFLYLMVVGLSVYSLALFWRSVNPRILEHVRLSHAPRRMMGGVLFAISSLFAAAWIVMLVEAIALAAELPAAAVIVLDLAVTLPLLVIVGVLLLRKNPMGYLLAPGAFGLSSAITLGVALGEFVRPMLGGDLVLRSALPYLGPGLICFGFSWLAFNRIARSVPRHVHPHSATTPRHLPHELGV